MKLRLLIAVIATICACKGTASSNEPDATSGADVAQDQSTADLTRDVGTTDAAQTEDDMGVTITPDIGDDVSLGIGSAGCGVGVGIPEGENTFTLENLERRYIVRLPNGYTNERVWPLVFALHGNGGSVNEWDTTNGDKNIRAILENDAILIVTEAIDGQWRDYNMPADTWPARIETELAYFDTIITRTKNDLCIDEGAIFSMGFSGGGSFSGVLGCRRTDIRAIAVGGSVVYFDEANCVGTPAAWIAISEGDFGAGREAYREYFRARAGCDGFASEPTVCTTFSNCDAQTPVEYCPHPGGHIWPDFGSAAMWEFFQQFVR